MKRVVKSILAGFLAFTLFACAGLGIELAFLRLLLASKPVLLPFIAFIILGIVAGAVSAIAVYDSSEKI